MSEQPPERRGEPEQLKPLVGLSEWDLLYEIRGLLAAILAALKPPRDTA